MTLDAELLALIQQSARGFGARHSARFASLETSVIPGFERELRDEITGLGWLSSFSDDDPSPDRREEALLLRSLVTELGRYSPAVAATLVVHHLCRVATAPSVRDDAWFGLDAAVGDSRLAPTLHVDTSHPDSPLTGTMRFVMGGGHATHFLSRAHLGRERVALVLVESGAASELKPIATLGLRGMGTIEATFSGVARDRYRIIAEADDVPPIVRAAFRYATPSLLGLLLSLLGQTQQLATDHALARRQNGRLLSEIPAVRQMLGTVERAIALVRVTERAHWDHAADAELLLDELAPAAARATDCGLQVLGGAGYIVGHGLERLWRDTRQVCQLLPRHDW